MGGVEDTVLIPVLVAVCSLLAAATCCAFILLVRRRTALQGLEKEGITGHTELAKVASLSEYPEDEIDIEQHSVEMATNGTPGGLEQTELRQWLGEIGLTQYFDLFVEHGYGADTSQLKKLDDATLIRMGIKKMAHRKRILLEQINTEDFNFGEDASETLLDGFGDGDEMYRRKSVKAQKDEEIATPAGATPSDPNKKQPEHAVVPSDLTLNGIGQNLITERGSSGDEVEDEEEDEEEEDSDAVIDDLLYQKPPAQQGQFLTK